MWWLMHIEHFHPLIEIQQVCKHHHTKTLLMYYMQGRKLQSAPFTNCSVYYIHAEDIAIFKQTKLNSQACLNSYKSLGLISFSVHHKHRQIQLFTFLVDFSLNHCQILTVACVIIHISCRYQFESLSDFDCRMGISGRSSIWSIPCSNCVLRTPLSALL